MNVNKVFLMGRLTADPELKVSQNGVPVVRFTIAVNRRVFNRSADNASEGGKPTVDFIDCVTFRSSAEFLAKYFRKGSLIIAFGSLQIEVWKDKNGNNQRTARVVVDEIQFGETKQHREDGGFTDTQPRATTESDAYANAVNNDFFSEVKDLSSIEPELPF